LASAAISVVIPAYNESLRITPFLNDLVRHCELVPDKYEVLIVDDGSTDGTAEVVTHLIGNRNWIRLIRQPRNQGKGAAVRTGMLAAKGRYRLFMDADGSFNPADIEPNTRWLDEGYGVVIGSRFVDDGTPPIAETWHHFLMRSTLNFITRSALGFNVKDSQCGFKFFSAAAANELFPRLKTADFSFDLELLHLASRLNLKIKESRVSCIAKKGSKVHILRDTLRLFLSIFKIRRSAHDISGSGR
jgi:dolichyl-phosphate beta-glucosyltransferase